MVEDNGRLTEDEYKLYPERRSEKPKVSVWKKLLYGSDGEYQKSACEYKVAQAFNNNPLVKILSQALKKNGCPFDLKRHVICESCERSVAGGYDSEYNQIVMCRDIIMTNFDLETILIHELIHMYDFCVNEINFRNLEHLACTEIRAANLTDCSFLHSLQVKQSSFFNIKNTHQYCVKLKATESLAAARGLDFTTAAKYVVKVFDKCYNDLEPFGRRIRRNSIDPTLAQKETEHFRLYDP